MNKIKIFFTPEAYIKMMFIIQQVPTEVCWHGCVKRVGNNFIIQNILVPPQKVTNVTVRMDDLRYTQWLNEIDDKTFESLKFEGHSHADMEISPSSKDIETEIEIAKMLKENEFYLFAIANKKNKIEFRLYQSDATQNSNKIAVYCTDTYDILLDDTTLQRYIKKVKNSIKED